MSAQWSACTSDLAPISVLNTTGCQCSRTAATQVKGPVESTTQYRTRAFVRKADGWVKGDNHGYAVWPHTFVHLGMLRCVRCGDASCSTDGERF